MTEEQYAAILARKGAKAPAKPVVVRKSKYGNRKTEVDGIVFDSAKEARKWKELSLLYHGGELTQLSRQVRYPLTVNGTLICTYVADFVIADCKGVHVIDVKGYETREWKIKRKLMWALYGIKVETK